MRIDALAGPGKRKVIKTMIFVVLIFSFLSYSAAARDKKRSPETNGDGESILKRKGYGEGKRKVELEAEIEGARQKVTVTVGGQEYDDSDLPGVFEAAIPELEKALLGKNKSLDEVRDDLDLITKIPGSGIRVSWKLKDHELIDFSGKLKEENLKEEGGITELQALLSANGKEVSHTFYVRVFPPLHSAEEERLIRLVREIRLRDEENKTRPYLTLPGKIGEEEVIWHYPKSAAPAGLLFLGIAAAGGVWVKEGQKKKKTAMMREDQMRADYSQIISRLYLFLKAGMTIHAAWVRTGESYEEKKSVTGPRHAYDEIVYSMHEMRQGVSESECYLRFADRCGLACYRRLGSLLSQNLRKGAKGLSELLKKEAADAFEERKNRAIRAGEEAGTKLLGPMFCMLTIVIVVIVVPAFLTVQM